ncbi:ACT domain-containing protein [Enterococcus innesii]|uniref:ACT domain-containing protein n=1 Tax=Enterococcus innesii TaxID=2839759 RepID=UPI002DB56012|nr:ACT domain-containing protein [Enterococcus innesii]MEB5919652.1 ACT domain-containing protein [Enterococcus innesii]MEB5952313.1 ACT domain-containing protein [Enterococcus innesii]
MKLTLLEPSFSVIQVKNIDPSMLKIVPLFFAQTSEELSLVLPTTNVPSETINREDGWKAIKIIGVLDFSLIGIIARISSLLAEESISIFALSTFNTDYILIKEHQVEQARTVLTNNDYFFVK